MVIRIRTPIPKPPPADKDLRAWAQQMTVWLEFEFGTTREEPLLPPESPVVALLGSSAGKGGAAADEGRPDFFEYVLAGVASEVPATGEWSKSAVTALGTLSVQIHEEDATGTNIGGILGLLTTSDVFSMEEVGVGIELYTLTAPAGPAAAGVYTLGVTGVLVAGVDLAATANCRTRFSTSGASDAVALDYTPGDFTDWDAPIAPGPGSTKQNIANDQLADRTRQGEAEHVVGPADAIDDGLALFDGTSGKVIKGSPEIRVIDSGTTIILEVGNTGTGQPAARLQSSVRTWDEHGLFQFGGSAKGGPQLAGFLEGFPALRLHPNLGNQVALAIFVNEFTDPNGVLTAETGSLSIGSDKDGGGQLNRIWQHFGVNNTDEGWKKYTFHGEAVPQFTWANRPMPIQEPFGQIIYITDARVFAHTVEGAADWVTQLFLTRAAVRKTTSQVLLGGGVFESVRYDVTTSDPNGLWNGGDFSWTFPDISPFTWVSASFTAQAHFGHVDNAAQAVVLAIYPTDPGAVGAGVIVPAQGGAVLRRQDVPFALHQVSGPKIAISQGDKVFNWATSVSALTVSIDPDQFCMAVCDATFTLGTPPTTDPTP